MQIKEIMTRDVMVVSPDTTLRAAALLMRNSDRGFLPVGEKDRLVGTVTDRDITIHAVAEGRNPDSGKVRDVMSQHVVYCFEDQDIREAADIMCQKRLQRLPVLNGYKRLVGIISLSILVEAQEEEKAEQALEETSRHTRM